MDTDIKTCRTEGCDRPIHYVRAALCTYCYNRQKKTGGTTRPIFVRYEQCTVEGCDRKPVYPTCKYCSLHHQRMRAHGTTDRNRQQITYQGESKFIAGWAETLGITPQAMGLRIREWNDLEKALTQPRHTYPPRINQPIRTSPPRPARPSRAQQQISHDNRTQSLKEWADELHINPTALMRRLDKKPIAEALTPTHYDHDGHSLQIHEWAAKLGVSRTTIRFRLKHWPIHLALSKPPGKTGPKQGKVTNYYDPIA